MLTDSQIALEYFISEVSKLSRKELITLCKSRHILIRSDTPKTELQLILIKHFQSQMES